ncbi:uracil phosphoribosyltransferase homolog isoform X3 [Nannospalax galili]|uniref:uracil phosphoribosyltransferase homolog isoform X3 n=1 Tax=Nannospalax galili TaxID=1026970 RepID=UPI00111C8885|nr:uracil phosphoribosyltransferase homolog isoform X3 [Nannospalax galili]
MATELQRPDSMPCHNQQVNSTSTLGSQHLQPDDRTLDHAEENNAVVAKLTLLPGHAHSSVQLEQYSQACGGVSLLLESHSDGSDRSHYEAPVREFLLGDCELSRQIRLVVEEGLNQLPYKECMVTTPTGHKYEGVKFEKGNCGVSIMRSGEAMEQGLRDCCRSIRIGKILIQSDEETQRAKVYYAKFPPDIYRRKVLLMYPILSTGNTVIEAVKVLIEHGVQPSVIILLSLFSTPHGAKSIIQEFPEITILTTEVHPVAPTHFGQKYFGTD